MSSRAARFKEADVSRALRVAAKHGQTVRIDLEPDGRTVIRFEWPKDRLDAPRKRPSDSWDDVL